MKPTRDPASSCPKPCAPLKKRPRDIARSPLIVCPRRNKIDRGRKSVFPSETPRFEPLNLAHKSGSALPWLVDDQAILSHQRIFSAYSLGRACHGTLTCACCSALRGFPRQRPLPLACHLLLNVARKRRAG